MVKPSDGCDDERRQRVTLGGLANNFRRLGLSVNDTTY